MIKVTKITTRPDTSVAWHFDPALGIFDAGFYDHLQNVYILTGKRISAENTVTNNGLTLTWISFWASQQDFDDFESDVVLLAYWSTKHTYYATNSVTMGDNLVESV